MNAASRAAIAIDVPRSALLANTGRRTPISGRALSLAAAGCCTAIVLGQLMFAAYVAARYWRAAASGRLDLVNKGFSAGVGYVPGQPLHNLAVALHLVFPVLLLIAGGLQLLPTVRQRAPRLHRWSGRLFMVGALLMAASGEALIATGRSGASHLMNLAISVDAALTEIFAALAWRTAIARRFDLHRRWALRLFLAANGPWFFRVGLMGWIVVNHGPAGFDPKTFQGPFITFLSFAQYLLPLAVLEAYLRARTTSITPARWAVAAVVGALGVYTAIGSVAASMALWIPHM